MMQTQLLKGAFAGGSGTRAGNGLALKECKELHMKDKGFERAL